MWGTDNKGSVSWYASNSFIIFTSSVSCLLHSVCAFLSDCIFYYLNQAWCCPQIRMICCLLFTVNNTAYHFFQWYWIGTYYWLIAKDKVTVSISGLKCWIHASLIVGFNASQCILYFEGTSNMYLFNRSQKSRCWDQIWHEVNQICDYYRHTVYTGSG